MFIFNKGKFIRVEETWQYSIYVSTLSLILKSEYFEGEKNGPIIKSMVLKKKKLLQKFQKINTLEKN